MSIELPNREAFVSLSRFADGLVHPSAAVDPLQAARHRVFIITNLIGGVLALALLPLYVAWWGRTDGYVVLAFGWLAAQAPIALYLSRTGRFETAYALLARCFAGLIGWISAITGGLSSFAVIWLFLVPAEASLSGSRHVVLRAALISLATLAALIVLDVAAALPPQHAFGVSSWTLRATAIFGGLLYGALIALRAERLHRRAESMAHLREARYRLVAENMGDIVSLHTPDGDAVFVTPAVHRVLGIDIAAATGTGMFQHVHVADRPAYLKTLSDALALQKAASVEFRALRNGQDDRPGSYVWLEMRCQPLSVRDPITGLAEIVAVTRDITERKRHEDELCQAREAAEQASCAKTRFLANISHELRTPLNAIIGFSEILSQQDIKGAFDEEQHRQYAQLIHDSGHHLLQVVSDILDMSKIESGNFEIVPDLFEIGDLIESCQQMVKPQADDKSVQLGTQLATNIPELVADRRACKQILLNLLSNAIKFTDSGGKVTIGASREGTRIALFVRDNGIGIARDDIKKLGNPFFQADSGYDRRHEGTGLGLSVVKGLVKLHGGVLNIQSELEVGTTVTIRVPINCEAAVEPLEPHRRQRTEVATGADHAVSTRKRA